MNCRGLSSCVVVFFSLLGLILTTLIGIRQRNGIYQSLILYLVTKICETLVLWHSVCTIYTCWNAKTSQWWWFRWSSTWYKLIPQTLIKEAFLLFLRCQFFFGKQTISQKTCKGEVRTGKGWQRQHWQGESSFLPSPSRLPPCVLGIIS